MTIRESYRSVRNTILAAVVLLPGCTELRPDSVGALPTAVSSKPVVIEVLPFCDASPNETVIKDNQSNTSYESRHPHGCLYMPPVGVHIKVGGSGIGVLGSGSSGLGTTVREGNGYSSSDNIITYNANRTDTSKHHRKESERSCDDFIADTEAAIISGPIPEPTQMNVPGHGYVIGPLDDLLNRCTIRKVPSAKRDHAPTTTFSTGVSPNVPPTVVQGDIIVRPGFNGKDALEKRAPAPIAAP